VLIYLPGTPFTNHGMLHMQIDVYEYGSTGVTTYIIGGHNWQNAWYNYTCNTIGTSPKKIRLAVKNNQYCVVLGEQGSTWSYGSVALTKITNGDYYKTNMDLTGAYSVVQDNTAETGYTWISADLNKGFLSSTGTTNYLARWTSPTTLGTGVSYDNGTNVGIGTTAPTQKLHVAGGLIATSLAVGETPYLITGYASGTSLWTIAGNNTQAKMLLATSHDWDRQIGLTYTPGTTGSAAGHLQIGQTDKNSTNWTHGVTSLYTNGAERIRIDNAGNVGVGTSSISVKLHVNGNAFFDLPAGGGALENSHTIKKAGQGQLNFGSYPGAWTPAIQIQNNDNTRFVWLSPMDNGSGANARLRVSGTGLDIYTGGAVDGGNYSTTFAANGNVGLGTTSPAVKLDVNGQIKISGGSPAAGKFLMSDGAGLGTWEYVSSPWESMGSDIRQACAGGGNDLVYEWGASYNNSGSVLRVTCNRWNTGFRVCTYPPYPTGDVEPFSWGGACWIWDTGSSWDDGCGSAYHSYYMQDAAGRYNMTGGNGCGSMPSVFRRKL
jgi:hypothetical protein